MIVIVDKSSEQEPTLRDGLQLLCGNEITLQHVMKLLFLQLTGLQGTDNF